MIAKSFRNGAFHVRQSLLGVTVTTREEEGRKPRKGRYPSESSSRVSRPTCEIDNAQVPKREKCTQEKFQRDSGESESSRVLSDRRDRSCVNARTRHSRDLPKSSGDTFVCTSSACGSNAFKWDLRAIIYLNQFFG